MIKENTLQEGRSFQKQETTNTLITMVLRWVLERKQQLSENILKSNDQDEIETKFQRVLKHRV